MVTETEVRRALAGVIDPELKRSIVELGMVRDLQVADGKVAFTLALTTLACPLRDQITTGARQAALALDGVQAVDIALAEMSAQERGRLHGGEAPEGTAEKLNHVKHIIAVMSGKGGVGKSLVAGLLAVTLRRSVYQVGVLDADITGPSIPKMFFPNGARPGSSPVALLPAETRTGIRVMSINLLLESEDQAVIWRGPLISSAIRQFWTEVLWGDLDYLVVDLPPGTSDASLTVLQSLPMSGVVLVTSPQDLSRMVVRKAAQMVGQVDVPLLGLVENMSYFVCPDTGKQHEIFGPSRAEQMADGLGVPLLGRLPLDPQIASLCDRGEIETYAGDGFRSIAEQIVELTPGGANPCCQGRELRMSFVMEPIGVIRTPFAEGDEIPIQPVFSQAIGQVEVYPAYADGLQDIEGFSHIILLYALHRSSGYALRVKPFLDQHLRGDLRHAAPAPARILSASRWCGWWQGAARCWRSRGSTCWTAPRCSTSNPTCPSLTARLMRGLAGTTTGRRMAR